MRGQFASCKETWGGLRAGLMGLLLAAPLVVAGDAAGQILPATPIDLAIAPNIQFPPKYVPVRGIAFNALYGVQDDVAGFAVGVFNEQTTYLRGFSGGILNIARANAEALQVGGGNACEGLLQGFQVGVVNQVSGELQGGQIAIANSVEKGTGFQIGFLNYAESLKGFQFGLLNFNDSGFLPFFPVFNFPKN